MIAVLWSVDGAQLSAPTAVIRWRDDRLGSRHFPNYSRRRQSTVLTVKRPVSKPCNVWKQGQSQVVAALVLLAALLACLPKQSGIATFPAVTEDAPGSWL
jgi:hypothetical protein